MSHEFFMHRLNQASPQTLNTLSFVSDIKESRGVSTSEAFQLVQRMRTCQQMRFEAESILEKSLEYYPPVFFESFTRTLPKIAATMIRMHLNSCSTPEKWSFLCPVSADLNSNWFEVKTPISRISGKQFTVQVRTSPADAFAIFDNVIAVNDTVDAYTGNAAEEVVENMRQTAMKDKKSMFFTAAHLGGALNKTITELEYTFAGSSAEVARWDEVLEYFADTIGRDLDTPEVAAKFLQVYGGSSAGSFEEAVNKAKIDEGKAIYFPLIKLMTHLAAANPLSLDVTPLTLYRRFKNEHCEDRLWPQRQIALRVLEESMSPGGTREQISTAISSVIRGYQQYSRPDTPKNISGEDLPDGARVNANITGMMQEQMDFHGYIARCLEKNRKFLVEYFLS